MSAPDWAAVLAGGAVGWMAAGRPEKTQAVRLLDVWTLGPLMIYAATEAEELDDVARLALAAAGAATISYNGRNYLGRDR